MCREREKGALEDLSSAGGIDLSTPMEAALENLALRLDALQAMIRSVVARVVRASPQRHELAESVFDAVVDACLRGTQPNWISRSWLWVVASRQCARSARRRVTVSSCELDLLPNEERAANRVLDAKRLPFVQAALDRMGPRARWPIPGNDQRGVQRGPRRLRGWRPHGVHGERRERRPGRPDPLHVSRTAVPGRTRLRGEGRLLGMHVALGLNAHQDPLPS